MTPKFSAKKRHRSVTQNAERVRRYRKRNRRIDYAPARDVLEMILRRQKGTGASLVMVLDDLIRAGDDNK